MAFRREDYPGNAEPPWLDRPDALEAIERRRDAGELTGEEAQDLTHWVQNGYLVFEGVLSPELAAEINADAEAILAEHGHLPIGELKMKFENVYVHSEAVRRAICLPFVFRWLDLILGTRVIPHQTLNMPISSQQGTHSDEILMTTHPPGYLAAVWFALEDITEDCGPLLLYPGSHRLPYVSAAEVGIPRGASRDECARIYDANYYRRVQAEVEKFGKEPFTFLPRQGDILIWHSNLLHGAHLTTRAGATRKSLIAHYFGAEAEHYSDLFQRACLSPDLRPDGSLSS